MSDTKFLRINKILLPNYGTFKATEIKRIELPKSSNICKDRKYSELNEKIIAALI